MQPVKVFKNRTTIVSLGVGYDVSGDVITSQIRTEPNPDAELIAEWVVTFVTDGTDGELYLTLDNSASADIEVSKGYMDLKRVTGGEPVSVIDDPLEVLFKDPVTA